MKRFCSLLLAGGLALSFSVSLSGCSFGPTLEVYCDGDLIRPSMLEDFTEETGIRVNLITGNSTPDRNMSPDDDGTEDASLTGEEAAFQALDLCSRLSSASEEELEKRGPIYDVVFTSGDTIGHLIEHGLVEALDKEAIPNAALIDEDFQHCDYDPDGAYSVTTLWQTMGLLWNSQQLTGQITSWADLWSEGVSGRLLMPDNLRDALALSLVSLGYDVNAADSEALSAAWAKLQEQQPLVQGYTSADGFALMTSGEAWITPAYSGDALNMMSENPYLSFTFPREGTWRVSYGFCIVSGTRRSEEAAQLIDYLCSAENLAKNANYTKYSVTSNQALALMDSSWRSNPLAYPDEALTAEAPLLSHLDESLWTAYAGQWPPISGD